MKAQSATEFFLYVVLFMFVAIVAFVMVGYTQSNELSVQKNRVAREMGGNFADAVSLAVRGGPGFSYVYYFPKTIYGYPYNITFKRNSIVLDWANEYGTFSYYYQLPEYDYEYGGCVRESAAGALLESDKCSPNVLILNNNEYGRLVISNSG